MAFLQNQWVKDPHRVKAMLDKYEGEKRESVRRIFLHYALFAGCLTGRRLKSVFVPVLGDDFDDIVWENASPTIGGRSSSVFPADLDHVRLRLGQEQPDIVMTFGKVAKEAVGQTWEGAVLSGPHPAARGSDTVERLRRMAAALGALIKERNS